MAKEDRANLKIPIGLHSAIAHWAVDHRTSMYEAMQTAWDHFAGQGRNGAVPDSVPPAHRDLVDGFMRLLASDDEMKDLVLPALRLWMRDNPLPRNEERRKTA
jgi:hypothetical protein